MIDIAKNFGPVRGLLFDMGDVLYDATVWRRWLVQLLGRMGMHTHYRGFFRVWDQDYLVDVHCGRREFHEAFQAFLLSAGLSRAQIDEVEAASTARKRELEASARPLPGVRRTIDRLVAADVTLGVLSDSEHTAAELEQHLARLGLGGKFAAVVSSIDLERAKPDPLCYRAALAAMGLTAAEAAFVGHDAEELEGAHAVGLRTLAFNYEPGASADRYLTRFDELLQIVDRRMTCVDAFLGAA